MTDASDCSFLIMLVPMRSSVSGGGDPKQSSEDDIIMVEKEE